MKPFLTGLTAAVALAFVGIAPAMAAQITGNLNMYGDFQPKIGAVNTQNMALANRIDFKPVGGTTGTFFTGSATGDLLPFASLTGGTIKDFTFSPFAAVGTFYTITAGGSTLSFDLAGLTINSQNASFLTMSGTGTLHLTGFDDTEGNWQFSGQSSNGAAPKATFSWSAGSSAEAEETSVPEPASLALLGLGFLGAGFIRRRKAAKQIA